MIVFDHVYKAFGDNVVLDDFSLDVPSGQTTVIIGASGSGKSVALNHIVRLMKPDAGRMMVDDRDVMLLDRKELAALRGGIGFVFQFAALFDSMTVEDNIRLGLTRRSLDDDLIDERIDWSLRMVELEDAAGMMPAELSGGMRKRAGIARAIALHPQYILYDEPTTGLDPITSAVINELMIRVRRELGTTSVVVTHDMRGAYAVGDRIAMLHEGRIQQVGTVAEIRATQDQIVRRFIEGRIAESASAWQPGESAVS